MADDPLLIKCEVKNPIVDICHLCLSVDRRLRDVHQSVLFAYGVMTSWAPIRDVLVCWECNKRLCNIQEFKRQIDQARELLKDHGYNGTELMSLSSLSCVWNNDYNRSFIHIEIEYNDNKEDKVKMENYEDVNVFVESPILCNVEDKTIENNVENKCVQSSNDAAQTKNNLNRPVVLAETNKETQLNLKETQLKDSDCGKKKKSRNVKKIVKDARTIEIENYKPPHYTCDICSAEFPKRPRFISHIKSHNKTILCEACGKSFSSMASLNLHSLTHVGKEARPHACDKCPRKFSTKDKLKIHLLIHGGVRDVHCDECVMKFWTECELRRHKKIHHGLQNAFYRPKYTRTKAICRYDSMRVTYNRVRISKPTTENEPVKKTARAKPLRAKDVNQVFECNFCSKKFKFKGSLSSHIAVHSGARQFKCDQCDKTFKYLSGLRGHQLIHTGVKAHQCSICGSSFTLRGNMVAHMKIHTNEKPYECKICNHRFLWMKNLRIHMKVHSK